MSEKKWEEYCLTVLKGIENAEETGKVLQKLQLRVERLITEVRIMYLVLVPLVVKLLHDIFRQGVDQ